MLNNAAGSDAFVSLTLSKRHSRSITPATDEAHRKIGSWGPRHSAINTASVEPVDICLYDLNTHRGLKLKVPAAYIQAIFKGDRGETAVMLDVWMPGFQPPSAVSALRDPDPKKRLQFWKDNRKDLLQITLSSKSIVSGYSESYLQRFRKKHRWTTYPEWGLEHYQDNCESLSALRQQRRDIATRKCSESSMETYVGRSDVTLGTTRVTCFRTEELCGVASSFEDMTLDINILRTELPRIKEYEKFIDQFLRKYFVEKLPSTSNK